MTLQLISISKWLKYNTANLKVSIRDILEVYMIQLAFQVDGVFTLINMTYQKSNIHNNDHTIMNPFENL